MLFKSVVSTVAFASTMTSAASSDVCSSTLTASSQADLNKISSCTTFKGDIILAAPIETANINGVQSIQGSLIARNITTLQTLNAPSLTNISDGLTLNILESLTSLSMPLLEDVGEISFVTLNALNRLSFSKGISKAKSLVVSDTTLTSLQGINLKTVDTLNINNNRFLNNLNFDLQYVSEILDFSSTANKVAISFPVLQWANNITIRDATSVSLPNVSTINSTLSFTNNSVETISLPKLKEVGGSLALVSNSQLTKVSFPKLHEIGGAFQVANNTNLISIMGFPNLTSVGGAIDFIGDFEEAEVPDLSVVRGGVNIDSSSDNFNCSSWNSAQEDSVIRGDSYQCKGGVISTSVALSAHATGTGTGRNNAGGSAASATATGSGSAAAATTSSENGAGIVSFEYTLIGALMAFFFQFL